MAPKNLFAGQRWRNRHRGQIYGRGERGGEGEMYGESKRETSMTICKIQRQQEFSICLGKHKQGLCINLEGCGGVGREMGGGFKREEIDVHLWLIHVEV